MFLEKPSKMLKYNFMVLLNFNLLAAVAYGVLVPFIFNLKGGSSSYAIGIGEYYFSVVGIILFPIISEIDYEESISEIIGIRKRGLSSNFIYRLLISLALMSIIIGALLLLMRYKGNNFDFFRLLFGVIITGLYLGMIGVTVANISKNYIAGYIIGFAYYLFEFLTKGQYTNKLYIFGLVDGQMATKYYLLGLIILLSIANILILKRRAY